MMTTGCLGGWLTVLAATVVASACGAQSKDEALTLDAESAEPAFQFETIEQGLSVNQLVSEVRARVATNGITPIPEPPVVTTQMFELGQALAFDKILSGDRNISCLTCHHPDEGTGDGRSLPLGTGGAGLGPSRTGGHIIPRNAPPLFNLHTFGTMFWDSRVRVVEGELVTPAGNALTTEMKAVFEHGIVSAQAMFPVTSREEMRGFTSNDVGGVPDGDFEGIWSALMARLGNTASDEYDDVPGYPAMFEAAYGGSFSEMNFAHAANAIAAFEVSAFAATNNPWQQFLLGNDAALSKKQLEGAMEFFDGGCVSCHSGSTFSGFGHFNTGLAQFGPGKGHGLSGTDDVGFAAVSGISGDNYRFRTPPLFNIELTGPYGHDGQYTDLTAMVRHYNHPATSLKNFKINQNVFETELYSLVEDNEAAVLAALGPEMAGIDANHTKIVHFMSALTDQASLDQSDLVPTHVPSGLEVTD